MTPAVELDLHPPGLAFTPEGVFERRRGEWVQIGRYPQMNHHIEAEEIQVPLMGSSRIGYKRGRETVKMTACYRGRPPADRGSRILQGSYSRYHPGEESVSLTLGMGPLSLKHPRRTEALVLWG